MKPISKSDEELIRGINRKNVHDFSLYYKKHCFKYIFYTDKIIDNWPEAELIVSDVFTNLWEKERHFEQPAALGKFLFVACKHSAINYLRRQQSSPVVPFGDEQPVIAATADENEMDAEMIHTEMLAKLYEEINRLPAYRKEILRLYLQNLDIGQIAAKMGKSPEAIRHAKFKALETLKKRMPPKQYLLLLTLMTATAPSPAQLKRKVQEPDRQGPPLTHLSTVPRQINPDVLQGKGRGL